MKNWSELNMSPSFLCRAHEVNLLGGSIKAQMICQTLVVVKEGNAELLMSRHQKAGSHISYTRIRPVTLENVADYRYFGASVRSQNYIHGSSSGRLKSGIFSYRSVRKLIKLHVSEYINICLLFWIRVLKLGLWNTLKFGMF
jgi:hypothetical protein